MNGTNHIPNNHPAAPSSQLRQPYHQLVALGDTVDNIPPPLVGLVNPNAVPEDIRAMSFDMQRMLISQAEDIDLIRQMMVLKDEAVQYVHISSAARQQVVEWPFFYQTGVYYIYKMTLKKGLQPIYIRLLANITKTRLIEDYPHLRAAADPPSLDQIINTFHQLESGTGAELEAQKNLVWDVYFERVLGEAYHYIFQYLDKQHRPPPSNQFLHQFCLLFSKFNRGFIRFDDIAIDRLQRNLGDYLRSEFFTVLRNQLDEARYNPQHQVTI